MYEFKTTLVHKTKHFCKKDGFKTTIPFMLSIKLKHSIELIFHFSVLVCSIWHFYSQ